MTEPHGPGAAPNSPVFSVVVVSREDQRVTFTYTNWKGKTRQRSAILSRMYWGSNEWHPQPQLLVDGYDLEERAPRTYAAKDMRDIKMLGVVSAQPSQ